MPSSPPLFPQDDGPPQISTLRPGGQPQPNAWGSGGGLPPGRPRMARGRRPVIFVAAALVVLLAAGATYFLTRGSKGASAPKPTVSLQLSLSKGQSFRYRFHMHLIVTVEVKATQVRVKDDMGGVMTWRVMSVDGRGVAHVTVTATAVTDTTNGHTVRQPKQTFHLLIAPDGQVLAAAGFGTTSGKGNTGPGVPGIDQILPLLPNSPVAVGARWSKSFDQTNPFGKGAIHYDTTSTFLRFEQVNGARAAVVQTTAALPINLSISERKALAGTGQPATGLDRGTNPVDRFSGHIDFSQIASIDPNTKSLIKSTTTGQLVLVVRVNGAAPADQPPGGRATLAGTVTLDIQPF